MNYQVDLIDLLKKIIRGHGLSFIYFEDEYHIDEDAPPIGYTPISANATCITVDDAITHQLNTFTSALFNEAYAVLKSDVRGLVSESDDRLPVYTDDSGNLAIDTSSTPSIPLSILLLSLDYTVERLALLANNHDQVEGMAISTNWLNRGLRLSVSANELVDTDKHNAKASAKDIARYTMTPQP